LLGSLQERQHAEKLPDLSALLELTRIVFQETPQTYMDAVRFGVVKLALFTGSPTAHREAETAKAHRG